MQTQETSSKQPRLSRRERENLRQRAEIFQAALRLFSEHGYHNVAMSQIATEAEFGIGTVYKFFENKERLYKELVMEMAERCHASIIGILKEDHDPLTTIKKYIEARHEIFYNNLPLMRLYFAETTGASFNLKAGLDKDLLELYDETIEELVRVFEKGKKQNVFRDVDPYSMTLSLEGALNTVLWRSIDTPSRLKETADISSLSDIFFRGVLVPEKDVSCQFT